MKKTLFFLIVGLLPIVGYSQFKLGVKLDPNVSLSRLEYTNESDIFANIQSVGDAKAKLNLSLFADIPIMNNIDLEIGLGWGNNNISFEVDYLADDSLSVFNVQNLQFALQYLNVPVGLKLYTNDISNKMRIYVQVGTKLGFRLDEKQNDIDNYQLQLVGNKEFTKKFDSSLRLGLGTELKIGASNVAFAGLEYERGLVNVVSKEYLAIDGALLDKSNFAAYNDQIKLVVGFKF